MPCSQTPRAAQVGTWKKEGTLLPSLTLSLPRCTLGQGRMARGHVPVPGFCEFSSVTVTVYVQGKSELTHDLPVLRVLLLGLPRLLGGLRGPLFPLVMASLCHQPIGVFLVASDGFHR